MNNDLKKEMDRLSKDLSPYASNTANILRAINDLSQKMDKAEAEAKKKEKSDFRRFVFSSILGVLTLIAGIVAAAAKASVFFLHLIVHPALVRLRDVPQGPRISTFAPFLCSPPISWRCRSGAPVGNQ